MKLSVISTGSFGNTYILESKGEQLILDCGCSLIEVKKKLNFDLSKIVGAFISHSHG